jgi:hypothetical protein
MDPLIIKSILLEIREEEKKKVEEEEEEEKKKLAEEKAWVERARGTK